MINKTLGDRLEEFVATIPDEPQRLYDLIQLHAWQTRGRFRWRELPFAAVVAYVMSHAFVATDIDAQGRLTVRRLPDNTLNDATQRHYKYMLESMRQPRGTLEVMPNFETENS